MTLLIKFKRDTAHFPLTTHTIHAEPTAIVAPGIDSTLAVPQQCYVQHGTVAGAQARYGI